MLAWWRIYWALFTLMSNTETPGRSELRAYARCSDAKGPQCLAAPLQDGQILGGRVAGAVSDPRNVRAACHMAGGRSRPPANLPIV